VEGNELTGLKQKLQTSMTAALKRKDAVSTAAFRTALAAIANAEAVESLGGGRPALGIGAREMPRRHLTEDQMEEIVRREVIDLEAAAADYESRGRGDEARRLRGEAAALEELVGQG
jgi:uncharacterized protein YqeY